jgi:hypothetical protein
MKTKLVVFLILSISIFLSKHAYADPLQEFEILVKQCQKDYDSRPSTELAFVKTTQTWVKRIYDPAKITYDVRKTDSLVSPFSAILEISYLADFETATDEEAAKAISTNPEKRLIQSVTQYNFLYKNSKWETVSKQSAFDLRQKTNDRFPKPSFIQTPAPKIKDMMNNCRTL